MNGEQTGDQGALEETTSILHSLGLLHAIVHLTPTGLKKATLDATQQVRDFLLRSGVHDYQTQRQGPDYKVVRPAYFRSMGGTYPTQISLFRPKAKKGDPRLWVRGLAGFSTAGRSIVLVALKGELWILDAGDLASIRALGTADAGMGSDPAAGIDGAGTGTEEESEARMPTSNEVVLAIHQRGFGGEGSVVVPGIAHDRLPDAQPAAGVQEACRVLSDALADGPATAAWVFLVGGPGNGKSHVLRSLLTRFDLELPAGGKGLAPRSGWMDYNGKPLLVVNDASIRPNDAQGGKNAGDLALDMRELLSKGDKGASPCALVCINRGIVIEELARVPSEPEWTRERQFISVLEEGATRDDIEQVTDIVPGSLVTTDFTLSFRIAREATNTATDVLVVFLDRFSLLEIQPAAVDGSPGQFERYRVMGLGSKERLDSPAGQLLGKLVEKENFEGAACAQCPAEDACPFLANARSLRNEATRRGVLESTRIAEIASGHLTTYRDLWALFAALIVGVNRADFAIAHPCQWVTDLAQAPVTDLAQEKLGALVAQRYYESIYPSLPALGEEYTHPWAEIPQIVARLRGVDPVLDSAAEWAGTVDALVESVEFQRFPLEEIKSQEPGFRDAISMIDEKFAQNVLLALVEDDDDSGGEERSRALRWCGLSIYRHFGFSLGHAAYSETAREWLALRRAVTGNEQQLPFGSLQSALNQLILPISEHGNNFCLLPVFEPRVVPVVSQSETDIWCRALQAAGAVSWRISAKGDALWVRLSNAGEGKPITDFQLDFALCREARSQVVLNSADGQACRPGFTEQRATVSPRLERVRASFLSGTAKVATTLVAAQVQLVGISIPEE